MARMTTKELKEVLSSDMYKKLKLEGVTVKQVRFIAHYITNGFNASLAVRDAGYITGSLNAANVLGCNMLKKPKIKRGLKLFFDDWIEEKKIKLEKEIIDTYYKRAFYDITTFRNNDGTFKFLEDIPEEWRCCIDGIEERYFGKEADVKAIITKLPDREVSLRELGKWINLVEEKLDLTVTKISREAKKNLDEVFNEGED